MILATKPQYPTCDRPARRRVVLLSDDDYGEVERVLAEPAAIDAKDEMRKQAELHPGRRIAVEWCDRGKWVRFWFAGERSFGK